VASVLFEHFKQKHFDRLVLATPAEMAPEMESRLHPYLRDCLAGRVHLDVNHSTAEDVRKAAAELLMAQDRAHEQETLDRLQEGVSTGGRGVCGLADVLGAINEARVETLLINEDTSAPGRFDPESGFLTPMEGVQTTPDGRVLKEVSDVVEPAIEQALEQSGSVMVVRHAPETLQELGGIGALLRF
jgi:peptide subunit release factor 1 (eRF1)